MISEMIPVLVGGILAIAGGAIQAFLSASGSAKQIRKGKREDAYLGYIEALLKLIINNQNGAIKTEEFWNSFRNVQARLRLYGSDNIIIRTKDFEESLYECWECGNFDVGNIEVQKMALIASIRKELNID